MLRKPDLVVAAHREFLLAGADICRTDTLQAMGSEAEIYQLNLAAAQLAKRAAAEVTAQQQSKPRLVAGVLGSEEKEWDTAFASIKKQLAGLVDGGVDLLYLDVRDAPGARMALYAVEEHFAGVDRPPLIINAELSADGTVAGQDVEAFLVSVRHGRPLAVGFTLTGMQSAQALAKLNPGWCHATVEGDAANLATPGLLNLVGSSRGALPSHTAALAKALAGQPRRLGRLPAAKLVLAGLEVCPCGPEDGLRVVGHGCSMWSSQAFRGFVNAYKYTKPENSWDGAVGVATKQCEAGADLLEVNLDAKRVDAKFTGKFVRLLAASAAGKAALVLSGCRWEVIQEGLRAAPGKCLVNAVTLEHGEAALLTLAQACQRYGAAIVFVPTANSRAEKDPCLQDAVEMCQRAFKLLRSKLDFPAEDIVMDLPSFLQGMRSMSSETLRDLLEAMGQVRTSCPGVSLFCGSSVAIPFREVALVRDALLATFLSKAVPQGLNFAVVDVGNLPRVADLEAPTKAICQDFVQGTQGEGTRIDVFLQSLTAPDSSLEVGIMGEVPEAGHSAVKAIRPSPQVKQQIQAIVQATGTLSASVFQVFGSKSHAALNLHRLQTALGIKRTVHFSSISVWMGQGGSGPVTGASAFMDGLTMWERHQGYCNHSCTVLWGAIGEIGLRKAIYGSRDVFAQFDLGQKLIGPADTQMLQKKVCCAPDLYEFIGLAYLDQTWKNTLLGAGGSGLGGRNVEEGERKTFADL